MDDLTAEAAVTFGKAVAKGSYDRGFLEGVLYTGGILVVGAILAKVITPEVDS